MARSIKAISTPISGSIRERNTVLDTSHSIPTYLMYHQLDLRRHPTVPPTCPVVHLDASRLCRVRSSALVAIVRDCRIPYLRYLHLGHVYTCDYQRVYSKLSTFLSFISQTAKRFERVLNELKRNELASCAHGYYCLLIMNIIILLETQFG